MINFNFLPQKHRKRLKTDIFSRLLWVLAVAVIFWALVFGIVIFSAIQYLSIQEEALRERIEKISSQERTIEAEQIEDEINEFNVLLSRVEDIREQNPYDGVGILEKLAPMVPQGAQLTSLSFNARTGMLFLDGHAGLRTHVITLQNNLEDSPLFESVEAPLSNLLRAEDINFQFTVKVAQ